MRLNNRIAAASMAALLAGGLVAWAGDDKVKTAGPRDTNPAAITDRAASAITNVAPAFPLGITPKELDDAKDLRELLAETTEAAVTKGGLNKLVDNFNDEDRNRFGKNDRLMSDNDAVAKLDGRIQSIRDAWKARYNEDIDIDDLKDGEGPYQGVALLQGEIQDPAAVARSWPVASAGSTSRTMGQDATADVADRPSNPLKIGDNPAADSNLEKGREVAIAFLPSVNGETPVTVSIIGEVQAWKVDVPNNIDAQQLYDNLLAHLTHFGDNQAQWPADRHQAERLLTHHVMQAVYGFPVGHTRDIGDVNKQQPVQPNSAGRSTDR